MGKLEIEQVLDISNDYFGFLDFFPSFTSTIPIPVIANITATVAMINDASTGCERSGIYYFLASFTCRLFVF